MKIQAGMYHPGHVLGEIARLVPLYAWSQLGAAHLAHGQLVGEVHIPLVGIMSQFN